jgi:sucrose-6-phosphate hydrolase SacC (GH32 family)
MTLNRVETATVNGASEEALEMSGHKEDSAERSLPAGLYEETYRPQFHFSARENWLNDPNGLVYYDGEYHLFFQHNSTGKEWGVMSWGHAVSADLVHWEQLDNAMEPDRLGTIFSGSAVVDWKNTAGLQTGHDPALVAFYTSAGDTWPESAGLPFTQSLAYSNDRGRTWEKYSGNPVVPQIIGWNRDPKVTWYAPGGFWVMALYLDEYSFALLTSKDLKSWKRIQTLAIPGSKECPDFFELAVDGNPDETKWVFSAANGFYYVGAFNGESFVQEDGPFAMCHGENFYAVQTYSDIPASDGRCIQIAWMAGGVYPDMPFNQQMSFPCSVTLRRLPDGVRLFRNPVREIETLYSETHEVRDTIVVPSDNPLSGFPGSLFDIFVEFQYDPNSVVTLKVHGHEIRYTAKTQMLSSFSELVPIEPVAGNIRLRILVDRTSIELFANDGRVSLSHCMIPTETGIGLFAESAPLKVNRLVIHELRSAWK